MKRKPILLKILAVFLSLSIGSPTAAHPEPVEGYALRPAGLEESARATQDDFLRTLGYSVPPAAGAEELPIDFEYQPVPTYLFLPYIGQGIDFTRLLQNAKGERFLVKQRGPPRAHSKTSDLWTWSSRNNLYREYIGFLAARAVGANVADIVIPPQATAEVLARRFRGLPEEIYLVKMAESYSTESQEIFRKDPRKAFSRILAASILIRKWDLHRSNEAPVNGAKDPLIWFDHDVAFHPTMGAYLWMFTRLFMRNYFSSQPNGTVAGFDLAELSDRIDMEELASAVIDIEKLDLQQLRESAGKAFAGRIGPIQTYLDFIEARQKTIRSDVQGFFREITQVDQQPIQNRRNLEQDFLEAMERISSAGAEESGLGDEWPASWPKPIQVTQEYAQAHVEELAATEQGVATWDEEGHWGPERFTMDRRPSTGTRLKDLRRLSFAAEDDQGKAIAYCYVTNGQEDYPVSRKHRGAFIFRLNVSADHQGKKLGPALLLASALAARKADVEPYITLEVDKNNTQAQNVYRSLGFQQDQELGERESKGIFFLSYFVLVDELIRNARRVLSERYGPPAAGAEEIDVEVRQLYKDLSLQPDHAARMQLLSERLGHLTEQRQVVFFRNLIWVAESPWVSDVIFDLFEGEEASTSNVRLRFLRLLEGESYALILFSLRFVLVAVMKSDHARVKEAVSSRLATDAAWRHVQSEVEMTLAEALLDAPFLGMERLLAQEGGEDLKFDSIVYRTLSDGFWARAAFYRRSGDKSFEIFAQIDETFSLLYQALAFGAETALRKDPPGQMPLRGRLGTQHLSPPEWKAVFPSSCETLEAFFSYNIAHQPDPIYQLPMMQDYIRLERAYGDYLHLLEKKPAEAFKKYQHADELERQRDQLIAQGRASIGLAAGAEEREYDGLTEVRGGEVASERFLKALKPGHRQIVVPGTGLAEITRIFRMPGMQLQASVVDAVGEQNVQDIPENPAGRQAFWEEWDLKTGDVILLDLPASETPAWLPAELPRGVAILNLPRMQAAGLQLPQWSSMVESALRRGGILPRVEEVVQAGAEQMVLDLGT